MYINIFPVQIYAADEAMDKLPLFVQRPIVQNIFRPDQSSPGSIQALGGRFLYDLRQGSIHSVNFSLELCHTVSDHGSRQSAAHLVQVQDTPPDVKSWTTFFTNKFEKAQKNKPYKAFNRF